MNNIQCDKKEDLLFHLIKVITKFYEKCKVGIHGYNINKTEVNLGERHSYNTSFSMSFYLCVDEITEQGTGNFNILFIEF